MEQMTSDVGDQMEARLAATKKVRARLQEAVKALDAKIKLIRPGEKTRESLDELEALLKKAEQDHATAPNQDLQDEREYMRRCDLLRKKKKDLLAFEEKQAELDALKSERKEKLEEVRSKERVLDDIYRGLKRVRKAKSLGLPATDILDEKIDISAIDEDGVARIIGKGGQNVKKIEESCGVMLDIRTDCINIYGDSFLPILPLL